ncbi:AAA family ATPase [Patescibacteria group bacterium]|nr:AAA family ATPase [Patescibacteria group bacterium]
MDNVVDIFMYLEKLEVQGFKSFANKNKLVFSGMVDGQKRGITSVVGPNGSGKSNIADAIRWVLGEQSSKLLRSKKSDDVIFVGSDKKARLNFAEVSLFLNNQDPNFKFKEFAISDESRESLEESKKDNKTEIDVVDSFLMLPEIVITRRVYRDGNSEYLINNNKVRLSDVQIFLAKASFGQKTYSVIGQGMVENFLNTSPAERKAFFDEATGVKQYQIKRDLSLGKLETSQENLSQVEMLLNEIEPRLNSLTRQVSKLKKRENLEKELREHQTNYYGSLWQEINEKLHSLNKEIKEDEENKDKVKIILKNKKEEVDKINQESSLNDEFLKLQENLSSNRDKFNKLEKQKSLINSWEELKFQNTNNNEVEYLIKEKGEKLLESEKIKEKLDSLSAEFLKQEEISDLEKKLTESEVKQSELQKELMKLEALLELRLEKSGNFDISFLFSRQNDIQKTISQLSEEISLLNPEEKNKEDKLSTKTEQEKELLEKIEKLESELKKIKEEFDPSNVNKINADINSLIKKISNFENSSDLSLFQKIIQEIKNDLSELLNFVSGQKFDNTIERVNKKILDLKKEREKINEDRNNFKLELQILRNKKQQLENEKNKLEREFLEINRKIESNSKEQSLDDLKKEKDKASLNLEKIVGEVSSFKLDLEKIKIEKENWQEKRRSLESEYRKFKDELLDLENKINFIKSSDSKNQAKIENLEEEIRDNAFLSDFKNIIFTEAIIKERNYLDLEISKTKEILGSLEEKLSNFNKNQEEKRQYLFNLQKEVHELESKMHSFYQKINNKQVEMAREETRMEDLENNILNDKIEKSIIDSYKKEVDVEINYEYLKNEIYKIKNQLEQIGGIDPEVEKEYFETKKRYEFLFEQTEDLNKTIKSLERVIVELDTLIKDRFDCEFKVISEKFNEYFKILFNGGQAKIFPIKEEPLEMDETNNEQGEISKSGEGIIPQSTKNLKKIKYLKKYNAIGLSGVDILAVPPGKKISSVNMLSGGERALTAIALICAIISANPAPFVVLDEVDAALDEANSERLAQILDDLSDKTQFIAITHNRATMKRANILYGVSMGSDGISNLLSIKLDDYVHDI